MNVLMVGATGDFGSLVIPELKKHKIRVSALVRNEDKIQEALDAGADEAIVADLDDYDSLMHAMDRVDGVFHLNPAFAENEAALGLNMVKAANARDVKKFVFSSVYHPSLSLVNHAGKRPVEEALYESDMNFIILQPAMFMQLLSGSLKDIMSNQAISMPYSRHSKMSYVDYREVAEVVGIAFSDDKLDYGTFELCAPGMVDRIALAEIFSKAFDLTIKAQETELPPSSPSDGYQKKAMQAMLKHYDDYGFKGGNSLILEAILGRKPKTVEQFIMELASSNKDE